MSHSLRRREVRLFISSTFQDLATERQVLSVDAFPRLRQECAKREVAFTEIDLRWGISDDEARAFNVLKICLEEIERCAEFPPFFVAILGGRYGWVPGDDDWRPVREASRSLAEFSQRHQGESITALEIQFAALDRQGALADSFFYFMETQGEQDPRQRILKKKIQSAGATVRAAIDEPKTLSDQIFTDLLASIERRFPLKTKPSAMEEMMAAQARYSAELADAYIDAPQGLGIRWNDIKTSGRYCLFGASGTGKSAWLAHCARQARADDPKRHVFIHHVGIGESLGRHDWMGALFYWGRESKLTEMDMPANRAQLQASLPAVLEAFSASEDIWIITDAVDQFENAVALEEWFPLGRKGRLTWIVSTANEEQATVFAEDGWEFLGMRPLGRMQAQGLIESGLGRYRKRLPLPLLEQCIVHPMAGNPLFLKVLYEELRAHDKHETLSARLRELLASRTLASLFMKMLERLSADVGPHAIYVLACIGQARHGASEPELRSALGLRPWDVHQVILIAQPYLISYQGRLKPFHASLAVALVGLPEAASVRVIWHRFWAASQDMPRRFEEYPWVLEALGELSALHAWIYNPETLAFAEENGRMDALAQWYTSTKGAGGNPALGSEHLVNWPLLSLRGLREFAYQIGDRALEEISLEAQNGKDGFRKSAWLIDKSRLYNRRGDQKAAVSLAQAAAKCALAGPERLEAEMNLVQMWAFGDAPGEALKLIRRITQKTRAVLADDLKLQAYLCQYTSFACHFLDLNRQSHASSLRAVELYGALGRRYDQGISWVNAGDGAWGAGDWAEAERCFDRALSMATKYALPQVEDIAQICLGNLRLSQGRVDEACVLYESGIALAERIGQDWDVLYGRVYAALAKGFLGDMPREFTGLTRKADDSGYHYLADLARAYAVVLGVADPSVVESLKDSPFPGPRAYALASLAGSDHAALRSLQAIVKKTEGIKGPSEYIRDATASQRMKKDAKDNVLRVMDKATIKLTRCNITACEAMCCHDGVYLMAEEEIFLKELLLRVPELKEIVPENFIEDGFWNGAFYGRKTATRPHEYKSTQFPAHFPRTRCVFGDDDGLCELEKFARLRGNHPWSFKPAACWMFPLSAENGSPVPPPTDPTLDPYYQPDYPGYVSAVPCGRNDPAGQPWWETLRLEVEYLDAAQGLPILGSPGHTLDDLLNG
ncbi:MAG: DUF4062 domain-containing protein [Gammaproteobacteria bacterium]|jgi:tetratricopeptide (TPR) repeat protein|nr:DUF4062 domain-containing protein [Gammaproteobacteria bacterium]